MNLYFLVEGRRTEKRVYKSWVNHVFPLLEEAERVEDLVGNNFFILSGNGYPSYCERIPRSLQDIEKHGSIDHYFVCVDAEEIGMSEKFREIESIITGNSKVEQYHIVVHDCCIETWFLGNRKMMKKIPSTQDLKSCKNFYDVSVEDPELMNCPTNYESRAQFHYDYLKAMMSERGLVYTKLSPGQVKEKQFIEALVERNHETGHISSFGQLVALFRSIGGVI